jgi:hypothetical protein
LYHAGASDYLIIAMMVGELWDGLNQFSFAPNLHAAPEMV